MKIVEAERNKMGIITVKEGLVSIEFERHLKHPADRVWKAITNQDELSKWYLSKVNVDGGAGGSIDLWFMKTHVYGKIIKWDPPRVFEHEWNIDPNDELPNGERTIVRWELSEENDGTLVRLSHLNLSKKTAFGLTEGIEPATSDHIILDRLKAFLNSEKLNIGTDWINHLRNEYRKASRI
jgi:uncharacterized protein YndB with AHSA1/START domain